MWVVQHAKSEDRLRVLLHEVLHDSAHELGVDPGLVKDGVEAHLQRLLAEHIHTLGDGWTLIRREYMTAIGPVDILARTPRGATVAVEIKRRGEIDGVEQLTRYLELMNRDPHLAPVTGIFAAQEIKPQARTLAEDRGIRCVVARLRRPQGHRQQRAPPLLRRAPTARSHPGHQRPPVVPDLEPQPVRRTARRDHPTQVLRARRRPGPGRIGTSDALAPVLVGQRLQAVDDVGARGDRLGHPRTGPPPRRPSPAGTSSSVAAQCRAMRARYAVRAPVRPGRERSCRRAVRARRG